MEQRFLPYLLHDINVDDDLEFLLEKQGEARLDRELLTEEPDRLYHMLDRLN